MANIKTAKPKNQKQWTMQFSIAEMKEPEFHSLAVAYFEKNELWNNTDQQRHVKEIFSQYLNGSISIASKEASTAAAEQLTEDQLREYADEDNKTQMQELVVLFNNQEKSFSDNRRFVSKCISDLNDEVIAEKKKFSEYQNQMNLVISKMNSNMELLISLAGGKQ